MEDVIGFDPDNPREAMVMGIALSDEAQGQVKVYRDTQGVLQVSIEGHQQNIDGLFQEADTEEIDKILGAIPTKLVPTGSK